MVKKGENIYKRKDKRWEGRYVKGRKENNRIHYGYIYGRSYKEVKEKMLQVKNSSEPPKISASSVYLDTLDQWSQYWFTILQQRVKQSTFVSYSNKYKHHISPYLGQITLVELTKEDINHWVNKLGQVLTANSIRAVAQVLRTYLEDSVRAGVLPSNPYKNIQLPKTELKKVTALTKLEQERLYNHALNYEQGFAIILALETGLRIGELAGLKWEDIDFSDQTIHVRRTIQRIQNMENTSEKRTIIIETSPKTHSSKRVIPLSKNMCKRLKNRREAKNGIYVLGGTTPCEPRTISYWFKKICQSASLPNIHFHALRHTFATRCLEEGVTIVTISALLGHHSTKMTLDTYLTAFLSEKREAIRLVNKR
ncbi:tyrosine-type recombinase/integrase [Enterococcus sp. 5H]|uniref:tyrosine-type recombinase/integrase n=1 Tax=Enterococcus sp. 5H TaxID=1229490 RepID=UPI0023027E82|nr:site-specific integrase [Enterococcus sp. 5H]MDA9470513.1 site-specific recombinase, phage integrase family [Enterococcus sp. 5H]